MTQKKKPQAVEVEQQNKSRKVEEIQAEYTQLCCKAGHTQYQISAMQKDLNMINDALRDLNFEAAAAPAKAAEEAKAPKQEEKASA